jgi:hypothetical protein
MCVVPQIDSVLALVKGSSAQSPHQHNGKKYVCTYLCVLPAYVK